MVKPPSLRLLAIAAAVAMLSACGGSDDDNKPADNSAAPLPVAPADAGTTPVPPPAPGGDTGTDTGGDTSTGGNTGTDTGTGGNTGSNTGRGSSIIVPVTGGTGTDSTGGASTGGSGRGSSIIVPVADGTGSSGNGSTSGGSTSGGGSGSGGSSGSGNSSGGNSGNNPTDPCANAGSPGRITVTQPVTEAEKCAILKAHNDARAAVNAGLPDLTWSDTLASTASAYSQQCIWGHSNSQYGENLFSGTAGAYTVTDAVNLWVSEKAAYTYAPFRQNDCDSTKLPPNTSGCGHYTQVVWKNTTQVGCGYALCSGNIILTCNYNPPGNYLNQRPY